MCLLSWLYRKGTPRLRASREESDLAGSKVATGLLAPAEEHQEAGGEPEPQASIAGIAVAEPAAAAIGLL
jgi:hypothetical protein